MFSEWKFSVYFLRQLYRQNGITYKKVKIGKKPKEHQLAEYEQRFFEMC